MKGKKKEEKKEKNLKLTFSVSAISYFILSCYHGFLFQLVCDILLQFLMVLFQLSTLYLPLHNTS